MLTHEEKVELCRVYNNSDCEAFEYMEKFCETPRQKEMLERVVTLNNETDIGWGREPATTEEVAEYYWTKWELLSEFGIDNNMGDAEFEGVFYQ